MSKRAEPIETMVFTEAVFDELASWLEDPRETAGVLLFRPAAGVQPLLLARELFPVPDDAYLERSERRLEIASRGFVPALRVAESDDSIACFVHSHPGGAPTPSKDDHFVDDALRDLFADRTRSGVYVSLIIGGDRERPLLTARIYRGGEPVAAITKFRVIGHRLRLITDPPRALDAPSPAFDRQIRALGREGQAVLDCLCAGVVGVGGTGSAVVEQLLRLGVGEVVVVDPDVLDRSNITRVHESTAGDAESPKVEVAARLAGGLGFGQRVEVHAARVNELQVAQSLTRCDVLFGCTDDHAGRAVLSRLAYWYLIPLFDMGVVVDSQPDGSLGVFGRLSVVQPGAACLICRGVVDPVRIREEALPEEERIALAEEGYVRGLDDPAPSVVAYTTLVASWAVAEFISRLLADVDEQPFDEVLLRIHDRRIGMRNPEPRAGHYCVDPAVWGKGDEPAFLGQVW